MCLLFVNAGRFLNLKQEIMNNNSRLILGAIAAAVAGVAIGMLLAPEKGSDLRRNISGSIDDLGQKINDLIADGKEKINNVTDEFKNDVAALKSDTRAAVEHGKKIVS
jgi:gas vesicle protein